MFQAPKKRMRRRAASRSVTLQPPVRGWVLNEALSNAKPGGARVLENWFPTRTGARLRKGCLKYATISSGPVRRMWTFKSGSVEQFFASDDNNIFEITNVADADVIPTAKVTGQTSGYYSTAQFGNAAGNFLYMVNGTDDAVLFNGSTFSKITAVSTPIAISGVATSALSFVWSFASRLFFVEKGTMNAWYLDVGSIGGTAYKFSLAGVFKQGGSLLCGGRWSGDSGDGLDDKCVFISTEGEVAIYQGTDPSSDADWVKSGVFEITPPLGPNALIQAGGDLLIATEDGLNPVSEAVNKDVAALSLSSVSAPIEPAWKKEVALRRSAPWEIVKWPSNNMMVVSLPVPDEGAGPGCLVANLETGAWAKFTGWETACIAHFDRSGYFGTNSGTIHRMEFGGSDDDMPYVCTYVGQPDHLRTPGIYKTVHSARAAFVASTAFTPKISASTDYQIRLPSPPSSVAGAVTDGWDDATWDVTNWSGEADPTAITRWVSIGRSGFVISPQIQITCGTPNDPQAELMAFDVIYEAGGVQV